MNTIIDFFSGKKTYIIGILMIVLGFYQKDQQMILTGLGFITARQAISKVGYAVTGKSI